MAAVGFQRTLSKLWRMPNHSAAELLVEGINGPSPAVRNGSIAALQRRRDETSQRTFLRVFAQFSEAEITSLGDTSTKLRTTIRKLLAEHDSESSRIACHYIVTCRAFDEFPALVTAACDPKHPGGEAMASIALELARALHDEIVSYRQSPRGRDPSFARRWALAALSKAVDQYSTHRRVELLEAFLLITTPSNHTLSSLLTDTDHPGHKPLMTLLESSPSMGAIEVLAKLFDDLGTPLTLLETAVARNDAYFRGVFLSAIGYPASPRVRENIARLKRVPLLEKPAEDWFNLPPEAQAVAVELVGASRLSRRTKLSIYDQLLSRGKPLARMAACEELGNIELPEATERLKNLLEDNDPQLVAFAARALRQHGFSNAVERLAMLLEHEDELVRKVAKSSLRDFTFLRYAGKFDSLDDRARRELGRIVRSTDDSTIDQIRREISAAVLARKLRGMQMASAAGVVDDLLELIIKQSVHQDAAVRAEAVQALAASTTPPAGEAIRRAAKDANALVRNRAAAALREYKARGTQPAEASK